MKLFIGLIILFFGIIHGVCATQLHVDGKQYSAIRQAIDASSNGDTIIVAEGVYKEGTIKVNKAVYLKGENWPVIDGQGKFETITVQASGVIIEGFVVQNVGFSYTDDWAGIRIEEMDSCVIRNNRLLNSFFGIYLQNADDIIVEGNEIAGEAKDEVNSGNGIHLWDCNRILIKNNSVLNHRDGIYLEFVEESKVVQNLSKGNLRYGLHFMFSNHDEYLENTFENNGTGVAVMFSEFIKMKNNTFIDNWGTASYGLLLKEIKTGELVGNTFRNNTIGIYSDGSLRLNISSNDFIGNGWAINMLSSSADNTIEMNNFISNTFDLSTNTGTHNNVYAKNYWDEYSGYDLDRDGYGDVPYRPVKLFNYVTGRVRESIILLHSFFVDVLNFAEKVTPIFTPVDLMDQSPSMKKYQR